MAETLQTKQLYKRDFKTFSNFRALLICLLSIFILTDLSEPIKEPSYNTKIEIFSRLENSKLKTGGGYFKYQLARILFIEVTICASMKV